MFQRVDSLGLTVDEQFQQARQLAFDGQYELARAIAKRLLMAHPGYHDVQLLVGQTHSWEGNYEEVRDLFKEVIGRSPEYDDSYNALFDLEYWDGNLTAALKTANEGLQYHSSHAVLLEKKIRVLVELRNIGQVRQTYDTLAKSHPNYNSLPELKLLVSD